MNKNLISLIVGAFFAIGLGLSGMTQPQKIIGFLDVFGAWDPTLIFVMASAVSFHLITYKLISARKSPLLDSQWYVPNNKDISPRLILGATIFGAGWGLAGYCPGPALTALVTGHYQTTLFVSAMLFGMFTFKLVEKKLPFNKG